MADFLAQRTHFQNNLLAIAKRLNLSNLARLLAFADDLQRQQDGKRNSRAEAMAKRTHASK